VDQLFGMENSSTIGRPDCNAADMLRCASASAVAGPSSEMLDAKTERGSDRRSQTAAGGKKLALDGPPKT